MAEKAELAAPSSQQQTLIIRHLFDISRRKHQNLNGRLNFDIQRANIVDLENMFIYLHQQAFRNFASGLYKMTNVAEPVQNIRNIFIRNLPIQHERDISQLLLSNATYDAHFIMIKPEVHTVVDLYLFPTHPMVTQMKL